MIVVKIGGSSLEHVENVARDLKGRQAVLVHGIGPQVDEATRKLGMEPRWYNSVSGIKCRYTDEGTRDVFVQTASRVNSEICVALHAQGVGSTGVLTCLRAKRKTRIKVVEDGRKKIIEGDYTGKVE